MQNAQMAVGMHSMNANPGGHADGTPMMGQRQLPGNIVAPRDQLNTYIYDYFIRNNFHKVAKSMIDSEVPLSLEQKSSPGSRNVNGVNSADGENRGDLPAPNLPTSQAVENSFLGDWWCQFWDVFSATRGKSAHGAKAPQYAQQARLLQTAQNQARKNQMDQPMQPSMNMPMGMMGTMTDPQRYQAMLQMRQGQQPNGQIDHNALKRAAAMNRNPNGVGPMGNAAMSKQMMAAQMSRDGSNIDINGQRGQSPNSNDNAPSPNKRARVEGALSAANMAGNQFGEFAQQGQNVQQKPIEVYAQNLAQQHRMSLNNHALPQAMNPGVQGSPMNAQGMEGQQELYNGNGPRQAMGPGQQPGGNHALQDYQMQLMLLEQQNKKRLLLARQEQDNTMGPGVGHQPGVPNTGAPFPPQAMSPQGRPGPSPTPGDQMKRTPKLNAPGLPGSPMPDTAMQQQRSSPAPMNFDVSQVPPGMPPQFPANYVPMGQPMMRPPSSNPGGFQGPQMNAQQLEMMRQGHMPNGQWRGAPGAPGPAQGMMPGQPQPMPAAMANPQQRNQMPPPPAPAGDQPRAQEPSPSQTTQAPPTPSQTAKGNPKKKPTKDNKKPAKAKGANAGATPASSAEDPPPTPTPSTPITPIHKASFNQNGQPNQQPAQAQPQAAVAPQQQPPVENLNNPPFGNISNLPEDFSSDFAMDFNTDPLNDFDFDSFMHNVGDDDPNGLNLGDTFAFGDEVQATGEI